MNAVDKYNWQTDSHDTTNTAEEVDTVHLDVQKDRNVGVTVTVQNENAAAAGTVIKVLRVIHENDNTTKDTDVRNETTD